MNPTQILESIPAMDPIYWGAVAAVALGLTLLVVAVVAQTRRWLEQGVAFRLPGPRALLKRSGRGRTKAPSVETTETGYRAASFAGPAGTAPPAPAGPEMQVLAQRLERVAETLEDMRRNLRCTEPSAGFSTLKAEDFGVEYLYKTTTV